MMYEQLGEDLDYLPCTYGDSKVLFRGPRVNLDSAYSVVLGGSEAFGPYIEDPFPDRLADLTRRRIVNLGVTNAGVAVHARDEALMKVIQGANTVVVQVTGAGNISNRFYSVHPRRNDRFLRHSILMETLFKDVDFTDFSFTRHMLTTLKEHSPERFAMVVEELSAAWVDRMRLLLRRIPGRKVLLWIERDSRSPLGPEPAFVTVEMVQRLEPLIDHLVHCDVSEHQREEQLATMTFPELDRDKALQCLSDAAHEQIARSLARVVKRPNGLAA